MTLRLYDTASRTVRDFVPRIPGQVGIYLCGLTLQGGPHIGHLRGGVNYDVLRRWLAHSGYEVRFIRNVTDIDDKILVKSLESGKPFWEIAYANERQLDRDYDTLGVLAPTYEPRATGHIPEMHELIKLLIEKGHAYPAEDGSGDVYFDVRSYRHYGALSGQKVDAMEPADDAPARGKRDPRDFALWKGAKVDEPAEASWPAPWGPGRPGWHIECSAMCWRYLGEEFDIHGGGLDLVFPHHENEVAQSHAAGHGFARYWLHVALLNLGGTKMAKSLGNVLSVPALVATGVRPVELRYYLSAPHYRSPIDFSDDALHEAASAYRRLEGFVRRAAERVGAGDRVGIDGRARIDEGIGIDGRARIDEGIGIDGRARIDGGIGIGDRVGIDDPVGAVDLPAEFVEAMNDDLNTSRALAVVHDTVREGNAALSDGADSTVASALSQVRAMLGILGLDPLDPQWTEEATTELTGVVDSLVSLALAQRAAARERKDWSAADAVRDQLKQAGILIEDTPAGPRWTLTEGH